MNDIEFQQAKRWLEDYCQKYSAGSWELKVEVALPCLSLTDSQHGDFMRFCLGNEFWSVEYADEKGRWNTYPDLFQPRHWADIACAMEVDPLHVHWENDKK